MKIIAINHIGPRQLGIEFEDGQKRACDFTRALQQFCVRNDAPAARFLDEEVFEKEAWINKQGQLNLGNYIHFDNQAILDGLFELILSEH